MANYSGDVRVNARRQKVAALKLQGYSHREIAVRLGISEGVGPDADGVNGDGGAAIVANDLKVIEKAWKESTARDFAEDKGRILAELSLVKHEMWQAWERSKRPSVQVKDAHGAAIAAAAEGILEAAESLSTLQREELESRLGSSDVAVERQTTVTQRDGDPRYTKIVLECIREECELLGLTSKNIEENTSPPAVSFMIHKPETPDDAEGSSA